MEFKEYQKLTKELSTVISQKDADYYICAFNNNALIGYICLYNCEPYEITGSIEPSYRKKHIFTNLFYKLKEKYNFTTYSFLGNDDDDIFRKCSKSLGATELSTEYLMEYRGNFPRHHSNLRCHFRNNRLTFFRFFKRIGHCSIYEENETINIYDIYVETNHRNKGYGSKIVSDTLWNIRKKGKRIILQVNGNNKPAFRIYSSCGFKIIDSVCYYSKLV